MQQPSSFGSSPEGTSAVGAALTRLAWLIGLSLTLALVGPQPLFAATFSAFLAIAAMALALSAALRRESLWAAYVTRWDLAAILYLLSGAFSWFVDHDFVREFLQMQAAGG